MLVSKIAKSPKRYLSFGTVLLLGGCAANLCPCQPTDTDPGRVAGFEKAGEFPVADNGFSKAAEILAIKSDQETLLYTDSPAGLLGFVDIQDPSSPVANGVLALLGEPTSVGVAGKHAFVAVNMSESFLEPSGHLSVVDLNRREIDRRCSVGGQPDAVAISPDERFVAVAVENERDEDLNDGALPQLPAGHLAIFDLGEDRTIRNCGSARIVALTGLSQVGGDDPEPEFVAINDDNLAAVTLQENNHIVIVDLALGAVVNDFSAGTVDLENVDLTDDNRVALTESLPDVPREPDAITWLDDDHIATANEGDLVGGSRSVTVFHQSGEVIWDSGAETEKAAAEADLYPDKRSPKKGTEPETVASAEFGQDRLLFVALERANALLVYDTTDAEPALVQLLPTGVAPEGILPLSDRNMVIVANEADPEEGVPSTIDLFVRAE
ncbi:MAG: hypothetical protein GDA50_07895 [Alphaproteobacteria bacterium GM202ARS2]|nr:hypothetical protein [Alphaproteobacteria bacterium GM202ARS2]